MNVTWSDCRLCGGTGRCHQCGGFGRDRGAPCATCPGSNGVCRVCGGSGKA